DQPVGVEDELLGDAAVEVLVALRSFVERDHRGVDGLGDVGLVVEDHLHQPAVVAHHRTLPGGEALGLGPARPMRIDNDPSLAASSAAPGSPVTYRPGMPSLPAARVTSMIELSTVAGASWPESEPWPRASKPTASTAASTSGTPRICSIWSFGSPVDTSTVSQPMARALASRSSFRSPTMTTAAPSSCADTAAARPTG